ncbi:MAG: hypothetical protein LBP69_01890 [Treponema sp.]|nr:hypothetical protein [Treponema sp.]
MKIPGAPFGPGTPEPGRSNVSGSKKPHEKTSVNAQPDSGVADLARSGKESAAEASKSAALSRRAADRAVNAANRAANGRDGSRPGMAHWTGRAADLAGKPAAGSPAAENRAAKNPVSPAAGQTARSAAARTEQAGTDSLRNLLSALKLPHDSLSEHIVSFSRYFSLPLERSSIGALRREVLVQKKREAAALGAAAAADKGLVLESRALEEYADAIDPAEWREQPRRETPERRDPGGGKDENGKKGPAAEDIKRKVTAVLEKGPIPDFINRIPGKNGRRWLVIPFSCSAEGIDVRASFRVLLSDPAGKRPETERFAADIAVFRNRELYRRWFFMLEGRSGGAFKAKRAEFSVSPPVSDNKTLIRELAEIFSLSRDTISLTKKGDFTDSKEDLLRTVDEEV